MAAEHGGLMGRTAARSKGRTTVASVCCTRHACLGCVVLCWLRRTSCVTACAPTLVFVIHERPAEVVEHHADGVPAVVGAAGTEGCGQARRVGGWVGGSRRGGGGGLGSAGMGQRGTSCAAHEFSSFEQHEGAWGDSHLTRQLETSTTRCCPPVSLTASATFATPCRGGGWAAGVG